MALDFPPLVSVPAVNLGRNPDLRTYPIRQVNRAGSDFSPEEKEASGPRYSGEASEPSVDTNLLAPRQRGSNPRGWSPRAPAHLLIQSPGINHAPSTTHAAHPLTQSLP